MLENFLSTFFKGQMFRNPSVSTKKWLKTVAFKKQGVNGN